jgi:branched-chain amino acid transport system ATP-binding protein
MPLLTLTSVDAFYGDFQALFGVGLSLERGETLALIGANGAGKSTLAKVITGLISVARDAVRFEDQPIGGLKPADILALGIAMVPEGRKLFPSLTVEENLLVGAYRRAGPASGGGRWSLASLYDLFPVLAERRKSPATALSGGQQQMVAIGRALMSNPSLLICDEISLGLAPVIIRDIYAALPAIRAEGTALILVEQDIVRALQVADRVMCLAEGRDRLQGRPADLTRAEIAAAYFGGPSTSGDTASGDAA